MSRFALCFLVLISSLMIGAAPLLANDPVTETAVETANNAPDKKQAEFHVLNGRIIRSLAIEVNDPTHILVGHKAKKPGSALVFQSLDGGKTWRTLNGNKSLNPTATDVQAVLPVSREIILAGTWKHGLYRSDDGGKNFARLTPFPSADVRDLQMAGGVVYAATARHGVFKSTDVGQTWVAIGPGDGSEQGFLWSLTATNNAVFASSPEKAVYEHRRYIDASKTVPDTVSNTVSNNVSNGDAWRKIFDMDGASAIAITPGSGGLRAIAGAKGLYISASHGEGSPLPPWRRVLDDENMADVMITRNNRIIAGSWDNGIAVLTSGGHVQKRLLAGTAVIHVHIANQYLFAGTWGDGLHVIPMTQVLTRSENDPPLIAAVLRDDLTEVERLLVSGDINVDVDAHDKSHNTALTFAARDGQTGIAERLINAGADPGWIDNEGVTPLILAAFKNHPDIVRLLLTQNDAVRPNHTDKWGRTAKDYAAQRGIGDTIYRLLAE